MVTPVGPKGLMKDYEALAEGYYQQILRQAHMSVDSTLSIKGLSVEDEAEPLLKKKLITAGFTKVHFHSTQRDGDEVYLEGNPFAKGNILRDAPTYVAQINTLLRDKKLSHGSITVEFDVPLPVQPEVRRLFTQPTVGWKKVDFTSNHEGHHVTFTA